MIEDQELRQLFEQESHEHIDGLESGIMALEKDASDRETRERTMREAHSLKGAARMLGLTEIEMLAHRIESLLRAHLDSSQALSASVTSLLLKAVDALRTLSRSAVDTAVVANIDVQAFIDDIDAAESVPADVAPTSAPTAPAPSAPETATPMPPREDTQAAPPVPTPEQPPLPPTPTAAPSTAAVAVDGPAAPSTEAYRIETIRVAPERLDHLMTQAGELVVIQKRISALSRHAEALSAQWQSLTRAQRALGAPERHSHQPHASQASQRVAQATLRFRELLDTLNEDLNGDASRLEGVTTRLESSIRAARMVPLAVVFEQFRRMVRDIGAQLGKDVVLHIEGGETLADKRIVEEIKDPLMHLLRNALQHGLESPAERARVGKPATGTITIKGYQTANAIVVEVADDGAGLNLEKIRAKALQQRLAQATELNDMSETQIGALIFRSGLSTQDMITDISGRGVGLDVVRNNVEKLKGSVRVAATGAAGTQFVLHIPQGFATTSLILVEIQGQAFGLPIEWVDSMATVLPTELYELEGKMALTHKDRVLTVVHGADILGLPSLSSGLPDNRELPCVIINVNGDLLGVLVHQVMGEQSIIMKPPGPLLQRVPHVLGMGILGSGEICTVLAPQDLIHTAHQSASLGLSSASDTDTAVRRKKVLLAEDSMVTRVQEKRHLEAAGFEVITAPDGLAAWHKLQEEPVDAVVSDILMPRMNGFELTEHIRREKRFADLPVILVSTLAKEEDQRRGLRAGANGYIIKARFDPAALIATLHRLMGSAST